MLLMWRTKARDCAGCGFINRRPVLTDRESHREDKMQSQTAALQGGERYVPYTWIHQSTDSLAGQACAEYVLSAWLYTVFCRGPKMETDPATRNLTIECMSSNHHYLG